MAIDVSLDIQTLIIEWVFRMSQAGYEIDRTTLRACALVCRAWTPTAQRLLFRRIRFNYSGDDHRIQLLVHTLRTHPHLTAHVRCIELPWPSDPPERGNACIGLLELCRHVEGISFMGQRRPDEALNAEMDARLRAIQLRPVFLSVDGTPSCVNDILQMFPGVRVLAARLEGYSDYPLSPTIEALAIRADSVRWCRSLSNPPPALRYLCLAQPNWSNKALCEHLITAGILPQLQSLQLTTSEFPPAEILKQLVQLKTLVMSGLPMEPVTLPPSLRHVGYHTYNLYANAPVPAELVLDPLSALPELQLVTVTAWVGQHVCAALEVMCREKGVDFGIYEFPYDWQEPENIDWI